MCTVNALGGQADSEAVQRRNKQQQQHQRSVRPYYIRYIDKKLRSHGPVTDRTGLTTLNYLVIYMYINQRGNFLYEDLAVCLTMHSKTDRLGVLSFLAVITAVVIFTSSAAMKVDKRHTYCQ